MCIYFHTITPVEIIPYPNPLQVLHLSIMNFLSHENTGLVLARNIKPHCLHWWRLRGEFLGGINLFLKYRLPFIIYQHMYTPNSIYTFIHMCNQGYISPFWLMLAAVTSFQYIDLELVRVFKWRKVAVKSIYFRA